MKKIFVAASAGLFCVLTACNNETKTSTASEAENLQTQKNLDATHVVAKAFETGDASGVDSVLADDFVDHTEHGDVKGKDSLKAMINMMHTNTKDTKQETIKELADNDYVFSWMRFSGTSNGAMGMPPGPYDVQTIEAVRCKDGKIVEHWGFMEAASMMKMMQPHGMGNMPKKDTAAKK
jgi:predicted SnoaL-like aldol condensation-catalyzing enzyme